MQHPDSIKPTDSVQTLAPTVPPQYLPQTVTPDKIFSNDHSWVATLSAEHVRTVIATGDVIPARLVNAKVVEMQNFRWPFEKTADFLQNADITFINLETPLIKNCPIIREGFTFCGDARNIEGLLFAGVDVANLGNNHTTNFGKEGVDETKALLEENGILATGIDGAEYKNIRGLKIAFLGYNDVGILNYISQADEGKIMQEIKEARNNADIVVVQFHWGIEYVTQPSNRQRQLGKLSIDNGADLVIGNHPHWVQPVEFYNGKLITYAHGNFVFDQTWSEETKTGVVGKYTFYNKELINAEFFPIYIPGNGQPYFLAGEQKQKILDGMKTASNELSSIN